MFHLERSPYGSCWIVVWPQKTAPKAHERLQWSGHRELKPRKQSAPIPRLNFWVQSRCRIYLRATEVAILLEWYEVAGRFSGIKCSLQHAAAWESTEALYKYTYRHAKYCEIMMQQGLFHTEQNDTFQFSFACRLHDGNTAWKAQQDIAGTASAVHQMQANLRQMDLSRRDRPVYLSQECQVHLPDQYHPRWTPKAAQIPESWESDSNLHSWQQKLALSIHPSTGSEDFVTDGFQVKSWQLNILYLHLGILISWLRFVSKRKHTALASRSLYKSKTVSLLCHVAVHHWAINNMPQTRANSTKRTVRCTWSLIQRCRRQIATSFSPQFRWV